MNRLKIEDGLLLLNSQVVIHYEEHEKDYYQFKVINTKFGVIYYKFLLTKAEKLILLEYLKMQVENE